MNEVEKTLQIFRNLLNRHPHLAASFERLCSEAQGKTDENKALDADWSEEEYILSHLPTVSAEFYVTHRKVREVEHQVGRFLNMRKIADEIMANDFAGDIVEFGTWQGLALTILELCFRGDPTPRRLIGIDSFEGLPETSTVWDKGQFKNTSREIAERNIERRISAGRSFTLIKGWFSDPEVAVKLKSICKSICLVHFDADLASSTTDALRIIEPYLVERVQPMFFLFDDWGCHQDEVPEAFLAWLEYAKPKFGIRAEKLYTTNLTRYYRISLKK